MKNKVSATSPKPHRRRSFEPITYDELLSNAGMSGFVSFLELPTADPLEKSGIAERPKEKTPYIVESPRKGKEQPAQDRPVPCARIYRAARVQDGHSYAEQAIYEVLWSAVPSLLDDGTDDYRIVQIGYDRLARLTQMSWVSVKANLRSLEKKLAIEVIATENSASREGKTYKIYANAVILERRRNAGLEWVRKTRGVKLIPAPAEYKTRTAAQ
jgi:hypothetical protein